MSVAKNDIQISRVWLLILSFIEGGAVMGAEISGAKMLAPYFGTSLYVWSSVMAITLGGLASGYYFGGALSEREHKVRNLMLLVLLASVFIMLMPFSCKRILLSMPDQGLLLPLILTSILFLFPPVFLMGAVSPMIISILAQDGKGAGKASGSLFALSTVGGITATFLFGFYLIPEFGLTKPGILNGMVFSLIPLYYLLKSKKIFGLLPFVLGCLLLYRASAPLKSGVIEILYAGEGLHGQMLVTRHHDKENEVTQLMVNRVIQASKTVTPSGEVHYFDYVHLAGKVIPECRGKRALLLGLGGGCVSELLAKKGYQTDAVDLDPRTEEVVNHFFGRNESMRFFKDDARHYIRNYQGAPYDLIFFDVFKAEELPSHLITEESMHEIRKLMKEDGLFVLNTHGFIEGDEGRPNASLVRTIENSGMNLFWNATGTEPERRNIVICNVKGLPSEWKPVDQRITDRGFLLNDDHPRMEKINQAAMLSWRKQYISYMIRPFSSHEIPLFF